MEGAQISATMNQGHFLFPSEGQFKCLFYIISFFAAFLHTNHCSSYINPLQAPILLDIEDLIIMKQCKIALVD
jgi:hypothetical protein